MKKTLISFVIFISVFLATVSYANTKAVVNVTAVRIRESMSTDSGIVTNLYQDDEVDVLEESGDWYKVQYKDSVGYAKAEFFKVTSASNEQTVPQTENVTTPEAKNEVSTNQVENTVTQPETPAEVTNVSDVADESLSIELGSLLTLNASVKVRIIPSISATEVYEIPQNTAVTVLTNLGKWYKITDQKATGWVSKEKLLSGNTPTSVEQTPQENVVEEKPEETPTNSVETPTVDETETTQENTDTQTATKRQGVVVVETARIREKASSNSEIVDTLDEDDTVTIEGEEGEFYKISAKGLNGYVSKSLIKEKDVTSRGNLVRENAVDAEKNIELNNILSAEAQSNTSGDEIIEFAKQYLNYPYVLGASSPEKGFDCSGFTRYVFGHFGYKLGQVAAEQTSLGDVVERNDLQKGDLLLFYNDAKTKIGHCGIYINGGDFIHSANPQRGVVIDNLNTSSYYSERFVTARRII